MTISPRIYLRRNGAMYFWRVGCLGGSVYVSHARADDEIRSINKAIRRAKRANYRRAVTMLRHAVLAAERRA